MAALDYARIELWQPRYSHAETDYLARVSKGTSKRWLKGYSFQTRNEIVSMPAVTLHEPPEGALSFIDLIEVVAIGRLKEFGFSLQKIRDIVWRSRELFGVERPLATRKFKVGGKQAFVVDGELLVVVGGKHLGERAWDAVLGPFLNELEYGVTGFAERWWPLGTAHPIVIDPAYGFGLPVIKGSGVRTEIIEERIRAGDLPSEIAQDFSLTETEIGAALTFEAQRRAA